MADEAQGTLEERKQGTQPSGTVGLRNFDAGVVETLGGKIIQSSYWLTVDRVPPMKAPPGQPGIPIAFSHPEDLYEKYKLPIIVIRRDDITPAMNRWHPGMRTWRAPAPGALPVEYRRGDPLNPTITSGFTRYREQQQATPFDITYTLSISARHRGFGPSGETPEGEASPRTQVNKLLNYLLRIFPPYCTLLVKDDLGDLRSYHAFMEALSHLDDLAQVSERVIGFALTLRVEAELDLHEPLEHAAAFAGQTIRETLLTPDGSE